MVGKPSQAEGYEKLT